MRLKRKNKKRLMKKHDETEDTHTEVLSQAEIDQLLSAINTGGDDEGSDVFRPAKNKYRRVNLHTQKLKTSEAAEYASIIENAIDNTFRVDIGKRGRRKLDALQKQVIEFCKLPETSLVAHYEMNNSPVLIAMSDRTCCRIIYRELCTNAILKSHHFNDNRRDITELEKRIMLVFIDDVAERLAKQFKATKTLKSYSISKHDSFQLADDTGLVVRLQCFENDTQSMLHTYVSHSLLPSEALKTNKRLISPDLELQCTLTSDRLIYRLKDLSTIKEGSMLSFMGNRHTLCVDGNRLAVCTMKNTTIDVARILWNKIDMEETMKNITDAKGVDDIEIQLAVELGRKKMTLKELQQLKVNSKIVLDTALSRTVNIYANNSFVGRGEVLMNDEDALVVKVTEFLNSGEELDD